MDIFPDLDGVEERVNTAWDTSGRVPVPRRQFYCPVCRSSYLLAKDFRFHEKKRGNPSNPYRCDVQFKCCDCSMVWAHGVRLSAEEWRRRPQTQGLISWREAKKLLESE